MRRVVKIGGSLLSRIDLQQDITGWFDRQTPAENIVIVGGGDLIEAVRQWDAIRPGEPSDVHWRCIDLLSTTYAMMGDWFPGWPQVGSAEVFDRCVDFGFSSSHPTLVRVAAFYNPASLSCSPSKKSLPLDWRTTTDSIAVLLGNLSKADEVVLLKSCEVDASLNSLQLIASGIIDEAVPTIEQQFQTLRVERLVQSNPNAI
ncbi:MAG: hypothetical protein WBD20_17325 [Pirellulaceae bacterium]